MRVAHRFARTTVIQVIIIAFVKPRILNAVRVPRIITMILHNMCPLPKHMRPSKGNTPSRVRLCRDSLDHSCSARVSLDHGARPASRSAGAVCAARTRAEFFASLHA